MWTNEKQSVAVPRSPALLPGAPVQLCSLSAPRSHVRRRQEVSYPLSQAAVVRCDVSSCLDDQRMMTTLTLQSRHHHCGGNHCGGGHRSTQESRREITALGGEKHPLPWQASTGLSSFPKLARHIVNPQAQSVTTASSPELSREEDPRCADVMAATSQGPGQEQG